ncbi:hypothetical protein PROFUN_07212 [Planoprotostelium fungivorum]|uniref:Uncharacterized protein n=1 Tax=Planoprotostelium fungivorum TaxID=1890364 RepID=A0A2P6NME8_9EUKA|nr:hypothetical protein PROFUN_07212 [Planoprotostelium fungivorum]
MSYKPSWRSFASVTASNIGTVFDSNTVDRSEDNIVGAFDVEEIDTDLFRSLRLYIPAGARGVYGGQVIAQATLSATKTVRPEMKLHSIHCYFIFAGDPDIPILYQVTRIREGKSYATRSVQARQRGKAIFTLMCSFHTPEPGLSHQLPMQELASIPHPDTIKPEENTFHRWISEVEAKKKKMEDDAADGEATTKMEDLLSLLKMKLDESRISPVETRLISNHLEEGTGKTGKSTRMLWFRSRAPVPPVDAMRKAFVAFASDFHLIGTVSSALGLNFRTSKPRLAMMVSLDHTMWFHNDIEPSQWMLYVMEAPWSGGARGLAHGKIYSMDGTLLVSVSQEGMIRVETEKKRKTIEASAKL